MTTTQTDIIQRSTSARILYVSFDVVPAPKGAAVHIKHFVDALSDAFEATTLVTVSPDNEIHGPTPVKPGLLHLQLPAMGEDLVSRVIHFRRMLKAWLETQLLPFDVIQFRSPLEGLWIANEKSKYCRSLIYEVNGLPSIELKYRYKALHDDHPLRDKLIKQEQICLNSADLIVTPSSVTQNYLRSRGISSEKIRVIRNGVDLSTFRYRQPRPCRAGEVLNAVYFGTLSPWQGIESAVRAIGLTRRSSRLLIVGSGKRSHAASIYRLIERLRLTDRITMIPAVSQSELNELIHQSHLVLAPLAAIDRNTVQGCCPLKVLESMASGTPVITSNLPVSRELVAGSDCIKFARPGSPRELSKFMDNYGDDFEGTLHASSLARNVIEDRHIWLGAGEELVSLYRHLIAQQGFERKLAVDLNERILHV